MIRWQLSDHIAHLTLDRGGARNAIPTAAWEALGTATSEIAASGARAVILRSEMPGIFSAGADLAEFRMLVDDPALRTRFRLAMQAGIEGVAALPMPVIAAVDGGCFGAGVALAIACDIVIAGDPAAFATTPAKLGLSYPASDVARLKARIGAGQAARMLFSGAPVDAQSALRIGLAQQRADRAGPAAERLAGAIAANAPDAVLALKAVLRDPAAPGHDAAFEAQFGSDSFATRLAAFLDGKR
jgi:enoyl-CoA hydratase/carnithine racemase